MFNFNLNWDVHREKHERLLNLLYHLIFLESEYFAEVVNITIRCRPAWTFAELHPTA